MFVVLNIRRYYIKFVYVLSIVYKSIRNQGLPLYKNGKMST